MWRKLGKLCMAHFLIIIITSTFEKVECVVPENIHTPTTELEIPRGGGVGKESEAQEIPEGRGLDDKNHFPRG